MGAVSATQIPGLGEVQKDDYLGWYFGPRMPIPVFGGERCCIVVEGYDGDPRPEEFHAAIASFLALDEQALKEAEPFVFRYYQDCVRESGAAETIATPAEVWRQVRFGDEPKVTRRAHGDKGIYVSVSCSCDWEAEHGLELVFKNGRAVNKVGPYDGHVTNADAYGEPSFEDVVYVDLDTLSRRLAARRAKKGTKKPAKKVEKKAEKKAEKKPAPKKTAKKVEKEAAPKKAAPKKAAKKVEKKPGPKKTAKKVEKKAAKATRPRR
jgi:hypothetical protein